MTPRGERSLAAGVALLLVLAGTALVVEREPATTSLAVSPPQADGTTSTTWMPYLFHAPTTATKAAPSATATSAPAPTTIRPTPTSVATRTTSVTSSPSTTVPVGPPIRTRPGLDAPYTWIEGTGCVGQDPAVRLELFDMAGEPLGGEGAAVDPDGSWSWPIAPPFGRATIQATCINRTTKAVHVSYPPLVVDFP